MNCYSPKHFPLWATQKNHYVHESLGELQAWTPSWNLLLLLLYIFKKLMSAVIQICQIKQYNNVYYCQGSALCGVSHNNNNLFEWALSMYWGIAMPFVCIHSWRFGIESRSPGTNMTCPSLSHQLFPLELWSTAWCSWSWLFLHLLSLLQKKGETQSMCVFHITRNFKFLRWVQSLCMPRRNSKCPEDRGHDYFVQLYFFDIWQALSVCRLDGRIERGME